MKKKRMLALLLTVAMVKERCLQDAADPMARKMKKEKSGKE